MAWANRLRRLGRNFKNRLAQGFDTKNNGKKWLKRMAVVIAPLLIKITVIVIFLACAWEVVSNAVTDSSVSSVSSYIYSNDVSDGLKNIYENTGSLILATDSDIEKIRDTYLENIRSTDTSYIYELLNSKMLNLNRDNSGVYVEKSGTTIPITLSEYLTLYEHILNAERYNFNRIIWGKYTRGVKQSGVPKLVVDKETRLQYPDDKDYSLEQFVNLVRPYLQISAIPLSMLSGIATNSKVEGAANFAYQIISEGYHKIEVDQHSLDTKTRVNNYRIYDEITTIVKVKRTCKTYVSKKGNDEVTYCEDDEIEEVSTEKDLRENISSTDTIKSNYRYVLTSVETFDYVINNKYNFKKYYEDNDRYNENLSMVNSRGSENEDYYEKEESIDSNYEGNSNPKPSDKDLSNYQITSTTENILNYKTVVEKKGKTYTDTLMWTDKLEYDEENSTEQEGYNLDYLQEYLNEESLSSSDYLYYSNLVDDNSLNLIDIINAKPDIFSQYTGGISENIGYDRSYLATSYDVLKNNLRSIYSEYESISYGQSLVPEIDNKKAITSSYDYSWLVSGQFGWPVPENTIVGHIWGKSIAYAGDGKFHGGVDLYPSKNKGKYQTDVVAARAGTVSIANDYNAASGYMVSKTAGGGYGNYIRIEHGDGTATVYAHLYAGSFKVSVGQHVEAGQVLAIMGSSGNSTGEHLHFEIWVNGAKVDPLTAYNVEPTGNAPVYEDLTDELRWNITSGEQYRYVSSKIPLGEKNE